MQRRLVRITLVLSAILVFVALAVNVKRASSSSTQDVLRGRVDNYHTGAFIYEATLTPANVNANQFGKLAARPVIGDIYAQPLYVTDLNIAGDIHNVVFVATAHNV